MTYNEISKELGINSSFLNQAETAGILPHSTQLPSHRTLEDSEITIIRRCALLKMLSFTWTDITEINSGTKDFLTALSEHVTRIVNDTDNISQAAIVLQNIKREKEDFFSFDPTPYLQHINDLKRNSGVFYDVNTSQLPIEGRTGTYSYGQNRSHDSNNENGSGTTGQILWDYKDYRRAPDNPPNFGQPGYDYTQNTRRPSSDFTDEEKKQAAPNENNTPDNKDQNTDSSAQGSGNQGSNNQNSGYQESGNQGTGFQGSGYQGSGYQGSNNQNSGYQESGNQGTGFQGSGYQGSGYQGSSYQRAGNQGSGYQENSTQEQRGYASFDSFGRPRTSAETTCPHPIRRYLARLVDNSIFSFLMYMLIEVVFKINLDEEIIILCFVIIFTYALEFIVEPLLISKFGTTVGKWLMGISLRNTTTKENLTVKAAYKRVIKLLWFGMGAYIPVYGFIRQIRSMLSCTREEVLPWDKDIDYVMEDNAMWRVFACLMAAVVLSKAEPIINYQMMIPSNRGEITETQFYENVEEVMKDMRYSGPVPPFVVTCKNGYVDKVELSFSANDKDRNDKIEMAIAFRAFAACTTGSNGYTFSEDSTLYYLSYYYQNLNKMYLNVHVTNEVTGLPDSVSNNRAQTDILSLLLMHYQADHVFTLSKSIN